MDVICGPQYEFGPFRLEPDQHLLVRAGQPVKLSPKAFELLVLLVRNSGQLVTMDQIMEALWPDSFVEEANIPVLISFLRKVLGDHEDAPYIQTVPKKGYRFTSAARLAGPVEPPPSASPAMSVFSRKRAVIPALALLIPVLGNGGLLYLPGLAGPAHPRSPTLAQSEARPQ